MVLLEPAHLFVNVTKDIPVNIVILVHLDTLEIHIKLEGHAMHANVTVVSIQLTQMHVMLPLENV